MTSLEKSIAGLESKLPELEQQRNSGAFANDVYEAVDDWYRLGKHVLENDLLSGGTKQAAKEVIDGLAEGAQKASAKRAVAAATKSESVSISQAGDGTITVTRTRPGFDGSQTFTKTIDSAGNSNRT